MIIKHKTQNSLSEADVTDEGTYCSRRQVMKDMGLVSGAAFLGAGLMAGRDASAKAGDALNYMTTDYRVDEDKTPFDAVTHINNYYEFGTNKSDPADHAHNLVTEPWTIEVDGECAKPGVIGIEDLIKPHTLEERIYRFRCVEAWSMVIPWVGVPLGDILKRFEPTSKAKYVAFQTKFSTEEMPGVRYPVLDWPYREGLRIDEAMHPLTLMAVGLYGKELYNQNGAPLRLVVPWKYGFKSIKSIVKISFREEQPFTSWKDNAPREYGFYSNVNPNRSHPRWSQATERRIGEFRRRDTLMFNGYEDEVAGLYSDMDLQKSY